jgi:hypothetical protein
MDMPQAPQKRPFGLYAIVVLQVLNIASILFDAVRLQLGVSTLSIPNVEDSRFVSVANLVIVLLLIAIVIGLWQLRYWAWYATMLLTGIQLVLGIWRYFHGGEPYLTLLLNALIVFYLNQRELRRIFEPRLPAEMAGENEGALVGEVIG